MGALIAVLDATDPFELHLMRVFVTLKLARPSRRPCLLSNCVLGKLLLCRARVWCPKLLRMHDGHTYASFNVAIEVCTRLRLGGSRGGIVGCDREEMMFNGAQKSSSSAGFLGQIRDACSATSRVFPPPPPPTIFQHCYIPWRTKVNSYNLYRCIIRRRKTLYHHGRHTINACLLLVPATNPGGLGGLDT